LIEQRAENALWWAVAAVALLALQTGAWIAVRGRWRKARERGAKVPEQPPRFMGRLAETTACFLMDLLPVVLAGLPVIAAVAWTMFVLAGVVMPLGVYHGPAAGAAGGLLVWGTGSAAGIAVLSRIGERHREAKERERIRIAAEAMGAGMAGYAQQPSFPAQAVVR
jgi:hypothetical protein